MSEILLSEKLTEQVDMTLPQIQEVCFLFPTPTLLVNLLTFCSHPTVFFSLFKLYFFTKLGLSFSSRFLKCSAHTYEVQGHLN